MLGDRTTGSMGTAGVPRSNQVRLLGSKQHPSRPLRRLLVRGLTPTRGPFRSYRGRAGTANRTPGPESQWGMDRPEPGPERGTGLTLRDMTPSSMATEGVPRRKQVRLLGSNQQPSRPLIMLLLVSWTPPHAAIFRLSVIEQVHPI